MSLRIARVLHAGYVFELAGTRVLFDPLFETPFSRNCHAFPDVRFDVARIREERFDALLISHYHDDHLSLESLDLIARTTPIYLYSVHEEFFALLREMGFREVHALDLNIPVKVGEIEVIPRPALDADTDSIFEVHADGRRILNVVDSWITDSTLARLPGPWDLVLWPFQTLREIEALCPALREPATGEVPSEWPAQWRVLNPRALVPSSCQFRFPPGSWLNHEYFPITYAGFARQVRAVLPEVQIVRMEPGEVWEWDAGQMRRCGRLPWVELLSSELVEYVYDPEGIPPSIGEIARSLGALDPSTRTLIRQWVRAQNFAPNFSWRLMIYDETGTAEVFNFPEGVEPEVLTEIPALKLWAALKTGESLTSIHARVTPRELREDFDPLEDPLLQALYRGDVGCYQRGQLRRLRGED